MRFMLSGERGAGQAATILASLMFLACTSAGAAAAPEPAAAPHELAVWVPLQLTLPYRHFTTQYSCSGLEARMKGLLVKLGARPDLEVRGYGCTRLIGPDPLAGVKVKMNVLEPAGSRPGLAAHWQRVDLLADRESLQASADCELIEQIAQQILPLLAVRNVAYHATCQAHTLVPGAVQLQADVLIADRSSAATGDQTAPAATGR